MRAVSELARLDGRSALVTGAGGHIGRMASETLAELGAAVALLDRDEAAVCKLGDTMAAHGSTIAPIVCDLADEAATRAAVRRAGDALRGLDIVVHCAGYVGTTAHAGWAEPFERQTVAAWDAALRVNLTAAFVIAQEAREALAASGRGSVILLGSIYGLVGPDPALYAETSMANPLGYGASKAGLLQLARSLATAMAPAVRVNVISPGGVWRAQPDAFHARYVARTPLRRMATEEDLKGAVAYLASDLSAYVTGHNLVVDGGWTAW